MDDEFLSSFDVSEPVYARKSAAPPPPDEEEEEVPMQQDENSSATANAQQDNQVRGDEIREEPMDQDAQSDPHISRQSSQSTEDQGSGKRPRNRSRAKRAEKKVETKSPDVNKLLASLEDPNLPPPPPLPAGPMLPPPPPPQPPIVGAPGLPSSENGDATQRTAAKGTKKSGKEKKTGSPTDGRGSAQRTSGVTPKSRWNLTGGGNDTYDTPVGDDSSGDAGSRSNSNNNNNSISSNFNLPTSGKEGSTSGQVPSKALDPGFQTHNRQWRADQSGSGTHSGPLSSSSTSSNSASSSSSPHIATTIESEQGKNQYPGLAGPSGSRGGMVYAYGTKPKGRDATCTDITSFRFTPDDDLKVDIVRRKMRGEAIMKPTYNNEKHAVHQLPTISSEDVTGIPLAEAPGATSIEDTRDRFISVADFATPEDDEPTIFHTIAKKDAIVFVIVTRKMGAKGRRSWDLPALAQCQDFSNDFISKIYENGSCWARSYVRSGKWGKLGTILLSSEHMEELAEFRRQFALLSYRNESFDMFPKDALTARADVSILLRASMKTFKTEIIPTVLFARNRDVLAGTLRVMSTTFYSAEELSHKGEPKQFWRSVDLKGNDQFLRCLRFIPEGHSFLLGYDSVQIRGGLRPQETNFTAVGVKRPWADVPPPEVPLLHDPRHIFPTQGGTPQPDEHSERGTTKRGRRGRGARRGDRGRGRRGFPKN